MKRRSNHAGVIALLLIGAAGVYGIGYYVSHTPDAERVPQSVRRAEKGPADSGQQNEPSKEQGSAVILKPHSKGGSLSFEKSTEPVPNGTDPIVFAVNRYLDNVPFVPPKARAVGVDVREGTAYIDFTEAMDKTYGALDEQTLLQGLCRAVGQFHQVSKVQFLVSGKPIDSFGNVDLSQPIDVIRQDDETTTHGA